MYFNFFGFIQITISVWYTGTEVNTHLFFLLIGITAFFTYPLRYKKTMFFVVILCAVWTISTYIIFKNFPALVIMNDELKESATFSTLIFVVAFFLGFSYYIWSILSNAEVQTELERLKSEKLLHNILPESIAGRLKDDSKNISDGFSDASILFADIVGFTVLSEKETPEKVVTMLNNIFSRFDDLVDDYSLEKIKTIGDA